MEIKNRDIENFDAHFFLPHRAPMLMVDKFLSLTSDTVSASFTVKENCPFLNEDGFLSESGLIENNAQTCSAIVGQNFYDDNFEEGTQKKLVGFISTIKKTKIYSLPKISETIITKASLISQIDMGDYIMCTVETSTFNNEDLIVDCTMNLIIREV